ncbi:hypothetical protein D3C87_838900 [compost metagenome]
MFNFFKKIFARIDNLGRVDNEAVYAALPGFTGEADHATLGARIDAAKATNAANRRRLGLSQYTYSH